MSDYHHPPMTVLVHPDDPMDDELSRRIIRRVVGPGEWPWMKISGSSMGIPRQHGDLTGWRVQPIGDLGVTFHHPVVITGHTVGH